MHNMKYIQTLLSVVVSYPFQQIHITAYSIKKDQSNVDDIMPLPTMKGLQATIHNENVR